MKVLQLMSHQQITDANLIMEKLNNNIHLEINFIYQLFYQK